MARVLALAPPPTWGDDEPGQPEPIQAERLRRHFSNRAAWRTRGPRRYLRLIRIHVPARRENVARLESAGRPAEPVRALRPATNPHHPLT
jgi:hypothetical protein